jgi:hypothetical protein
MGNQSDTLENKDRVEIPKGTGWLKSTSDVLVLAFGKNVFVFNNFNATIGDFVSEASKRGIYVDFIHTAGNFVQKSTMLRDSFFRFITYTKEHGFHKWTTFGEYFESGLHFPLKFPKYSPITSIANIRLIRDKIDALPVDKFLSPSIRQMIFDCLLSIKYLILSSVNSMDTWTPEFTKFFESLEIGISWLLNIQYGSVLSTKEHHDYILGLINTSIDWYVEIQKETQKQKEKEIKRELKVN